MTSKVDVFSIVKDIGDNEDNIRKLVIQIKTGIGVIPFVGAGLSIPFGFPGWSAFLIIQAKKAGIEEKIQQYLDAGKYEEAAEDLLAARGYLAFHDAIDNTYGTHRPINLGESRAITLLSYLSAGPVITTNFDHTLEKVFEQEGNQFERIVWGARVESAMRALYQNRRFLLKIHGDVEDSTDRILTKTDYQNYYGSIDGSSIDWSLPLPKLLQQMLQSRPLLFLGCSLNYDRTVTILEHVSKNFRFIEHYAIVEAPSSPAQFNERARFLSNHNIRPIWYPSGQYELIEDLLNYLSDKAYPFGSSSISVVTNNVPQRLSNSIARDLYDKDETIGVPKDLVPDRLSDVYGLRVKGNAMIDALIADGDLILMRYTQQIQNGQVAAVRIVDRGEITIKQVYFEGDKVRLQPVNPTLEAWIEDVANVEVQGQVVGVVRSLW